MNHHKILYLSHCPWNHVVDRIYKDDPNLLSMDYADQKEAFLKQGVGYADSLSHWMRLAGYDATELCWDVEPLQKQWAKEHRIPFNQNWKEDILLHQIKKIKPSILYCQDIYAFSLEKLKGLKKEYSFLKKIIIFRGYPGPTKNLMDHLQVADCVLVGSPHLVRQCAQKKIHAHLFYHSFDERFLAFQSTSKDPYDVTFIGSSGVGYGLAHFPRYCFLVELLKKNLIEAFIDEAPPLEKGFKTTLKEQIIHLLQLMPKGWHKFLPKGKRSQSFLEEAITRKQMANLSQGKYPVPPKPITTLFQNRVREGVFGKNMYSALSNSHITLNRHTLAAEGFVDNIRLFQATGMGACLITDTGENIRDLFEPDQEVITYNSIEECIEKIKFLQENPAQREQIAHAGQKRTLACHTVRHRIEQLKEYLSI